MKTISAKLPTKFGTFDITVIKSKRGQEPFYLTTRNLDASFPVTVRIHSECLTGDLLKSMKCDCGNQLEKALEMIKDSENGMLIYLRQEGRGIGLYDKIKAYRLQDEEGLDTYDANLRIGHKPDEREYSTAIKILKDLKIKKINIITNNPSKINELKEADIEVVKIIPLISKPNKFNEDYLRAKEIKFKHGFHNHENKKYN